MGNKNRKHFRNANVLIVCPNCQTIQKVHKGVWIAVICNKCGYEIPNAKHLFLAKE